ncbi:MAG: hypothetical protein AAF620_09200 [Bacteroidota bacterium]
MTLSPTLTISKSTLAQAFTTLESAVATKEADLLFPLKNHLAPDRSSANSD